jgi:hypothetical protein
MEQQPLAYSPGITVSEDLNNGEQTACQVADEEPDNLTVNCSLNARIEANLIPMLTDIIWLIPCQR